MTVVVVAVASALFIDNVLLYIILLLLDMLKYAKSRYRRSLYVNSWIGQ